MSKSDLEPIVSSLQAQGQDLASRVDALKDELRERESELKRVEAAVRALCGKPNGGKASVRRPSPSKVDVMKFAERLLTKHGELATAELRQRVENRVKESGKSRMGLALRFKEALADPRFVVRDDICALAVAESPSD